MEKILYGGAFNPPTKAHLEIIKYLIQKYPHKKVVVLPTNDYYNKDSLASFYDRLQMVSIMCKNLDVEISDYEAHQTNYLGTYFTLQQFNHPLFVIGSDSLEKITTWINYEVLVSENKFLVFPRDNINCEEILNNNPNLLKYRDHFEIVKDFSSIYISSSLYRSKKDKNLLVDEVYKYIVQKKLYR